MRSVKPTLYKFLFTTLVCHFVSTSVTAQKIVADYDAEVRRTDGRVDVPTLIQRLQELKVNTYFFLIWHRETDWDDLKLFLPEAQKQNIDVWVYLVPPSESPPSTTRYSEPYQLDYIRWAEEIARLGLEHPNLKAFVIDDFWANRAFYTPAYLQRMRTQMRAIHPTLTFWPLMYYREIDRTFTEEYGDIIDGVVSAYPADAGTVQKAWRFLNDQQDEPARWAFTYPSNTRSAVGEFASVNWLVDVSPANQYRIHLTQRDSYEGPTAGYHFKQILIDDQLVWEEDVAGGLREWGNETIDVTSLLAGKTQAQITFRTYDKKPVSNYTVLVEIQEPTFEGFTVSQTQMQTEGSWTATNEPALVGQNAFHIPLIVMTAANESQFVKRWGEPGSPERIRDKLKMALVEMRRGYAEGVVTYALPKVPDNDIYTAVRKLFLKASTSTSSDFDQNGTIDFDDFLLFASAFGTQVGENATIHAPYDLDLDTIVGFGDFVLFVQAFVEAN